MGPGDQESNSWGEQPRTERERTSRTGVWPEQWQYAAGPMWVKHRAKEEEREKVVVINRHSEPAGRLPGWRADQVTRWFRD